MRFWDASALVPLLVRQHASLRMRAHYRSDPVVAAWWGSRVECESAVSRLERGGLLERRSAAAARLRLDRFAAGWHEVQPADPVRDSARRLLRVHDLRAADALQLAAALAASRDARPASASFASTIASPRLRSARASRS